MSVDDRLTYLEDTADCQSSSPFVWTVWLPPSTVKELVQRIVSSEYGDDDPLELGLAGDDWELMGDKFEVTKEAPEFAIGPEILTEGGVQQAGPFALDGKTLRKLSLIRPQDYPLDLVHTNHKKYGKIVLFKKGPTISGATAPFNREVLRERLDDGAGMF